MNFFSIVQLFRGSCWPGGNLLLSCEGKVWRGVLAGAERREAWQGVGRVKKFKSGTGNLKNFSWNKPTEGNGSSTCICTVMC